MEKKEYENESGDWGHLPNEPCRYCRSVGKVFFRDDGKTSGDGAVEVRCDACGRSWVAGESTA